MRTARQQRLLLRLFCIAIWTALQVSSSFAVNPDEIDGPNNRKMLGSSVVTSVSVIMDHPNGTKTYITDGQPEVPPTVVGSPAALMSPDRYEFYSFGKNGELVKKLMTLDQIQGLIAGGDEPNHDGDGYPANFYQQPLVEAGEPEGVNKVLERVQNVLKSEMETAHIPDHIEVPPVPDDSWSILFPGLLNGEFDFKEVTKPTLKPVATSKKPVPSPQQSTTLTRPQVTSTPQAVRVTTPRQPITLSSKMTERPSQHTTARRPPLSPGTTAKYSAHYSTPPPNLKLQNKPVTVVKKPTSSQPKPQQPVKNTIPKPLTNGTAPVFFSKPMNATNVENIKKNITTAASFKVPNATIMNSTSKPTTMKGTTEKMKPSGIPTITHYLPFQTSIGPSEAVKTVKPAITTKPTVRTTQKPVTKPMTSKPSWKPNIPTSQPTNKTTVLPSTTKIQPVAEKLVQKQPTNPILQGSSSEVVRVSVTTPSGPPSTLKITASSTAKPVTKPHYRPTNSSTAKPATNPPKPIKPLSQIKAPLVSVLPNRTVVTTMRPTTTQRREPVSTKPHPTPAVSTSSVATHKPVFVKTHPAASSPVNSNVTVVFTTRAPTSSTKYVPPSTTTQSRLSTTSMPINSPTTQPVPSPTTTVATTVADVTVTLSNELDQVPLKLAASLKDPQQNVFEQVPLMSTTLKELPTTIMSRTTTEGTTKWEQIINSKATEQTTTNSATVTTPLPETSTTTTSSSAVSTDIPTTLSKVYIINNSEPQKIKLPTKSGQKQPQDGVTMSTVAEWVNSRTEAQTTDSFSTTSTTSDAPISTIITETPSTTTFKDQVMEDGINAVASILLDDSVVVDKSTLAERLAMSAQPESQQTTEYVQITSATQPETTGNDMPAFRQEPEIKTSTSRNEDSGRTTTSSAEKTTWTTPPPTIVTSAPTIVSGEMETATPPSTTIMTFSTETSSDHKQHQTLAPSSTTSTVPPSTPGAVVSSNRTTTNATPIAASLKKDEIRKPQPVKESKLNPDSDEQPQPQESQMSSIVHHITTEGTTMLMEQVKLTEKVPVTHASPQIHVSPTVKVPLQEPKIPPPTLKRPSYSNEVSPPSGIDLHPAPYESMGAEASTAFLAEDVRRFADLCNELAFRLWTATTSKGQISSRSLVMSPFAAISLLAMVFLGARGATSGQMNEILRLDDMVTFNPHQVLQNVTDSVINSRNLGVATAAFVRQLYSDKSKGKILDFYKERAQQYYGGHVEEVSFATVGDVVRRRTNLLVKRQTLGKVPEYLRGSSLNLRPPLAAFSANIFQTDCDSGSTEGRDGEMYFVVRPSTRQRRLVPVPAVVWRTGFSAGYEPSLDATSVCLGQDSVVSTLLILPGQQGQVAPGDGLARLEQRLIETSYRRGGWSRLLRSLLVRPGLELQVPRFSHRSVLNVTAALARMGLRDLFSFKADLRGLNGGVTELHLSDMVQVNTFSTCGEEVLGARHHIETYPASPQRTGREEAPLPNYLDDEPHYEPRRPRYHFNGDDFNDGRPRTGRLPMAAPSSDPAPPRLRFDRPFLYIVRHNPSGIILHIGRFNPRLLP